MGFKTLDIWDMLTICAGFCAGFLLLVLLYYCSGINEFLGAVGIIVIIFFTFFLLLTLNTKIVDTFLICVVLIFLGIIYYRVGIINLLIILGCIALLIFIIFLFSYVFIQIVDRIERNKISMFEGSEFWPDVEGEIISAMADIDCDSNGVYPRISYKYIVDGIVYYSDILSYGNDSNACVGSSSKKECEEKYKYLFTIGNPVRVYYNPSNPNISVIFLTTIYGDN